MKRVKVEYFNVRGVFCRELFFYSRDYHYFKRSKLLFENEHLALVRVNVPPRYRIVLKVRLDVHFSPKNKDLKRFMLDYIKTFEGKRVKVTIKKEISDQIEKAENLLKQS